MLCPDKIRTAQWLAGDAGCASRRLANHRHHHVRPCRSLRALGATHSAHPGTAGGDGRLYRIRPTAVRAYGSADLPEGPIPARSYVSRGGADARGRHGSRCIRSSPNIQTSWVKMGHEGVKTCLRSGRQRPRRHADGRNHHPLGRREQRAGNDTGADGKYHSGARPRTAPTRRPSTIPPRRSSTGPRSQPKRQATRSVAPTTDGSQRRAATIHRFSTRCCSMSQRFRMTAPFLIQPEVLDAGRRRAAMECLRAARVTLPTWSELAVPALIPTGIGQVSTRSARMSRMGKTCGVFTGSMTLTARLRVPVPGHVVLPEALTGVKSPIVVLLGNRFPMIGAHKVLAAYACLVPRLVTGQFDPEHERGDLAIDRKLLPRRRRHIAHSRLPRRGRAAGRHEPGALRLAGSNGFLIPPTSSGRPGRKATSRKSTTSAPSSRADEDNVILNQFSEFANYLIHYHCTGRRVRPRILSTCKAPIRNIGWRLSCRRPARPARSPPATI